jgi:hypothetical protein
MKKESTPRPQRAARKTAAQLAQEIAAIRRRLGEIAGKEYPTRAKLLAAFERNPALKRECQRLLVRMYILHHTFWKVTRKEHREIFFAVIDSILGPPSLAQKKAVRKWGNLTAQEVSNQIDWALLSYYEDVR